MHLCAHYKRHKKIKKTEYYSLCVQIFMMHSHGRMKFGNGHVDLEGLRPTRPMAINVMMLPMDPRVVNGMERAHGIRQQLSQVALYICSMAEVVA